MNEAPKPNTLLTRLKYALQALAMPAEIQLGLYPPIVCKADELALDFDNWYRATRFSSLVELTRSQIEALDAINEKLNLMSDSEKALWTDDGLRSEASWSEVRLLSQSALSSFNWETEPPPKTSDRFV